ncbi:hypothetical protein L218DRAFT_766487 [Marasmius fiardii PR-910]|nr:hypothetical protein L218DRAFT_766487 [Marasmius fiardii PR-910]
MIKFSHLSRGLPSSSILFGSPLLPTRTWCPTYPSIATAEQALSVSLQFDFFHVVRERTEEEIRLSVHVGSRQSRYTMIGPPGLHPLH